MSIDWIVQNGEHQPIALTVVTEANFTDVKQSLSPSHQAWLSANDFAAKAGKFCVLPSDDHGIGQVLVGFDPKQAFWQLGALATALPQGEYVFDETLPIDLSLAALAWGCQTYAFDKYKTSDASYASLIVNDPEIYETCQQQIAAVHWVRDLINTPCEDMGPENLIAALETLAKQFGGRVQQWKGDALLKHNFPAVHAVGRASDRAPRIAVLKWGQSDKPLLCLVGKGVCFDTGGYNLKPANGMRQMKKDMGGAAHVLGLAYLIMSADLPIRLQVIIPAVENSVAGNAYKPGDVLNTRKGSTVEVGNTDAEGRLILADALCYAVEQKPDLIIDYATLTGAARIAMGPDLPAMFCNRQDLADQLSLCAQSQSDPLWRMPLFQPYAELLKSPIADLCNIASVVQGGAITAALFLEHFVDECPWVHFDIMASNDSSRPGRPKGGEAHSLRAGFVFIRDHFAKQN